jgi:ABC transporter substrate binding protein
VILAAGGTEPAKIAKEATSTIPIVFASAADPVRAGIVASINRPGGNVTGVSMLGSALEAKRLGLLNEIVPGTATIGVLMNPNYPDASLQLQGLQEAAHVIKRQLNIVHASTDAEIDAAFTTLAQQGAAALLVTEDPFLGRRLEESRRAEDLAGVLRREVLTKFDGLVIGSGPLFWNNRTRIVALAAESGRPAIYPSAIMRMRAASCVMVPIYPPYFGVLRNSSIIFSRAGVRPRYPSSK